MEEVWLAVDEDGCEWWYSECPMRVEGVFFVCGNFGELFPGAIKLMTGKDLTWQDEPVKISIK